MSGTDPDKKKLRKGDPTQPAHSGDAPEEPTQPADLPKVPGITLQYEIARGGMGVVYGGRQDFLDRRVAVKFLSVELGGASFAQRFQREAKILANIKHPNIVACHMADTTEDGQSYLVMEFIDGPSLKAWIGENGPTSSMAALRLTRATAQALSHAHQSDIIHRDVKPENILLETMTSTAIDIAFPFTPKLVDLGLARMTHEQVGMGLTSPGSVMGTPSTMSPEQFDDPDSVDFRSDIYGLGCCLYEMLVGQPAFRGNRLTDIVTRKREPIGPNPCDDNPSVPVAVGALTQRMLACDRSDRPASYRELDQLLDELMQALASKANRTDTVSDIKASDFGDGRTIATKAAGGPAGEPSATQPAADPTAPGLLRTAELDFLSEDGGVAARPAATAFQDGSTANAADTAATATVSGEPARSKAPMIVVAVLAIVAAAVGVWFGTKDDGVDSGNGAAGGAGSGPGTTNSLPVIAELDGPTNVDLGIQFTLTVKASDPDGDKLRYAWEWPEGTLPASKTGQASVAFLLNDGLPGAELTFTVEVLDHADEPVSRTHKIVVGRCPEERPLIGYKSNPAWQVSETGSWVEKDDIDRPIAGRAKGKLATLATSIGHEAYWHWYGALVPTEEGGDGQVLVGLGFGAEGYAVDCRRTNDEKSWSIELLERAPGQNEWRSMVPPVTRQWNEAVASDNESRAWFSLKREAGLLTMAIGEAVQPPTPKGQPLIDPTITLEPAVVVALTEEQIAAIEQSGRIEFAVIQGRGVFRIQKQ